MSQLRPFNLNAWVSEHRHELKPPVGNKLLYNGELKVMLVSGPNSRNDYHIEAGEEWFYQLEGRLTLRLIECGHFHEVVLNKGDTFCLPAYVPHSPQRAVNSLGIVVERRRRAGETDALEWYCSEPSCRHLLYRGEFVCNDLESDLKPVIDAYKADVEKRRCGKCGAIDSL